MYLIVVSLGRIETPSNVLIKTVVNHRTPTQNNVAAKTPAKYG